jgi:hypothetical protein
MATFLVSFEINDWARANNFREHLKTFGSYCPVNNTSWAIVSNNSADELKLHLLQHLNGGTDRMIIVRAGSDVSWVNSYGEQWDDWLEKNFIK